MIEMDTQNTDQDLVNAQLFGNDQKIGGDYSFMSPMTNAECAVSPSAPCLNYTPQEYTQKMIETYKNLKSEIKQ